LTAYYTAVLHKQRIPAVMGKTAKCFTAVLAETKQFRNCFEIVLFQFYFSFISIVRTILLTHLQYRWL